MVKKRRDGLYTCLDCSKICSEQCSLCKNWHLFELNQEVIDLSYQQKNDRFELLSSRKKT